MAKLKIGSQAGLDYYNQRFVGRDPDLLPHKLRKMAQSPFGFFRGTFHLFASDWLSGLSGSNAILLGALRFVEPVPHEIGDVVDDLVIEDDEQEKALLAAGWFEVEKPAAGKKGDA